MEKMNETRDSLVRPPRPASGRQLDADGDLTKALFCKLAAGDEAAAYAEQTGANPAVVRMLTKTASPAALGGIMTGPYSQAMTRLIANHSQRGAFNSMRPFMTEVPLAMERPKPRLVWDADA